MSRRKWPRKTHAPHEIKEVKAVVAPRIKDSRNNKIIVSKEVASAEAEEEEEALENKASGMMSFFGSRAL